MLIPTVGSLADEARPRPGGGGADPRDRRRHGRAHPPAPARARAGVEQRADDEQAADDEQPGAGRVGVVTDSTSSLSPDEIAAHGIEVVPLDVIWDGLSRPETDLADGELVAALRAHKRVTTSRPSSQAFVEAYSHLVAQGAREIVSIHLSADASGTVAMARLASRAVSVPVHVVDSRTLAMGLGYGVLAAASARASSDGRGVAQAALAASSATEVLFVVETLEYLRRGGRISMAGAVLGQALAVKPVLAVQDGGVVLKERVRTMARAIERLVEVISGRAARGGELLVTVQHLGAPERADQLADRIAESVGTRPQVRSVGAVVGAHAGPGVVGVAIYAPGSRPETAGPAAR